MKRLCSILLITPLTAAVVGCAGDSSIEGAWVYSEEALSRFESLNHEMTAQTGLDSEEMMKTLRNATVEFKPDGTAVTTQPDGSTTQASYTIEDDTVTMEAEGATTELTLNDGILYHMGIPTFVKK
ncbi:hypothetical protein LJC56_02850 [Christensenellaceae bacterium OttesenSCG-928-K19]|nr:hypothetical protein [Christensenellaceae bacterium OttesenSCG-928-K19]